MVVFHMHKSGICVCLGIAVAILPANCLLSVAPKSCYSAVIRCFLILQQPAKYQILPAQFLYFTAGIYALHVGAHQHFK